MEAHATVAKSPALSDDAMRAGMWPVESYRTCTKRAVTVKLCSLCAWGFGVRPGVLACVHEGAGAGAVEGLARAAAQGRPRSRPRSCQSL